MDECIFMILWIMQFESTNQKILQVECMLHCECVLRWHEFSYIFAPMNYLLLLLARKIVLFWALLSMVRFLFPFFLFVFVLLFCSIQFIYLWFFFSIRWIGREKHFLFDINFLYKFYSANAIVFYDTWFNQLLFISIQTQWSSRFFPHIFSVAYCTAHR